MNAPSPPAKPLSRRRLLLDTLAMLPASMPLAAADRRRAGLARARRNLRPALARAGLQLGAPLFIRIFKQSHELEVWLQEAATGRWQRFRGYPICSYSGALGPKLREGDHQSPEGFYSVGPRQMNPWSRYHLAFNLGYPNRFDRSNGRIGSYLMVHGDCVSIGCYAMTDRAIEEIYALAEAALAEGQPAFQVHAFPARLSDDWLAAHTDNRWHDFWRDLKACHDAFERDGQPPVVRVEGGRYRCE